MEAASRKSWLRRLLPHLLIVLVTLVVLDVLLMLSGLFPPRYNLGHPTLGWVTTVPKPTMNSYECLDPETGISHTIALNEDGHRTSASVSALRGPGSSFEIAVSGDSHTDLCVENELVHFGVLEERLSERGIEALAYSYGAGRYSPLQAYLAIEEGIRRNQADALVLNLYMGNDFYDLLRIDDRPHFVREGESYVIEDPVWYEYDSPEQVKRSRLLYILDEAGKRSGVKNFWIRLSFLYDAAKEQGAGLGSVFLYLNDIRRSIAPEVGYPAAFAAQILNQQLFFHRFPGSLEESRERAIALLKLVRERHPDLMLVLSPIPSYQLAHQAEIDAAFLQVLEQLPVPFEEGKRTEQELYDMLRRESQRVGWLFIDNQRALAAYEGDERLYNSYDYHITPAASALIGEAQAEAIAARLHPELSKVTQRRAADLDQHIGQAPAGQMR